MSKTGEFIDAFPFQEDVLTLPVENLDDAANWYGRAFGLEEIERKTEPEPTVIMQRGGAKVGFAITGEDSTQDGAAILVKNVGAIRDELEAKGVTTANWRVDERDGEKLQVFFVVAPDGLCFYFHEPVSDDQ